LTLYDCGSYNTEHMITIHKCLRCGHEWPSRLERLPKQCPKCRSPYWNKKKWKGIKQNSNE
jgi:predicted  nucleic acid-binding Zn-ribbon protein